MYYSLHFIFRDHLKVTNAKNENVGVYCGDLTGKTVHITGKFAVVIFHSGLAIRQFGGFSLYFIIVSQGKQSASLAVIVRIRLNFITLGEHNRKVYSFVSKTDSNCSKKKRDIGCCVSRFHNHNSKYFFREPSASTLQSTLF